jgi:hypothetical protein
MKETRNIFKRLVGKREVMTPHGGLDQEESGRPPIAGALSRPLVRWCGTSGGHNGMFTLPILIPTTPHSLTIEDIEPRY